MLKLLIYKFKRPYHLIKTGLLRGWFAQYRYHHPERRLQIVMVTGTDGKTTTATLLHHVLTQANIPTGLITTVSAKIGNQELETGLHVTALQPDQLYQLLKQMIDQGCSHVILEMTSHGGYQARQWGIKPQLGIITNITAEHLDYHLNLSEYAKAKVRLFKNSSVVIMTQAVAEMPIVNRYLKPSQIQVLKFHQALPSSVSLVIRQRFPEKYNQLNAHLCWLAAKNLGLTSSQFQAAIVTFPGVPGRMTRLALPTNFSVIVDFAHTPAGVNAALSTLKQQLKKSSRSGRLISVLGCAGLRDISKRPIMGKIAARLSDLTVFTAEDPRSEDTWSIIRQMSEQLVKNHDRVISIADRGEAIHFALTKLARPNDTVVILGKGHEQSMCMGQIEHPWSDEEAVKAVVYDQVVPQVGVWQPGFATQNKNN